MVRIEFHPMAEGYQLTLVYNLRVTERVGGVLQNPVLAESSWFPLYEGVREILEHPGFMREGTCQLTSQKSPD
jgi:hypothetical protein